jgi:EmrB/QacA subfamily drug resistance transporter
MINLDSTIVNVALPSIRADLVFSEDSLVWVVNAYLLTFGGFLLLSGAMGDRFGHRRMFSVGIAIFTLASLGCGLAHSRAWLIGARAIQGVGAAVVSATAFALIMTLFTVAADRAKAIGIFGFVGTGGSSMGLLLGGVLTGLLSWHWIFLINLPIGFAVSVFDSFMFSKDDARTEVGRLDVAGAVTVTTSLMLTVSAIVESNTGGWDSARTLTPLVGGILLFCLFLGIESRARAPLVPLRLFRLRNLAVANIASAMWAVAALAFLFICALYLQFVLHYTPLQVGLTFLPANVIVGACSLGVSANLVNRFGIRRPLTAGLMLAAAGLALLGRTRVDGTLAADVLPGMFLLALGGGVLTTPLLLAAMSEVTPSESGVASGIVSSTFMMGGAFGLAILASMAAGHTNQLVASGMDQPSALNSGYHVAFVMGATFATAAALLSATLLRTERMPAGKGSQSVVSATATGNND